MPIKENLIRTSECPYCLGYGEVSVFKPLLILGKFRIVKEITEKCAYCNLIKISKSHSICKNKKD